MDAPGLGACPRCPYRSIGPAARCWDCAQPRLIPLAARRCGVCDQPLGPFDRCPNYWCGRDDRGFDAVWALALHRGPLRQIIARYKYRGGRSWATILGRLLAGYLLEHSPWFDEFELVTACPGWPTAERPWDHMASVVAAAAEVAGDLWPFDFGAERAVIKTAATVPLMSLGSPASRRLWAACELRAALAVPDPSRVARRHVLVVDDVFTDGSTLREVALALRRCGAAGVSGLVFARQGWRQSPGRGD